jgi:hypothetical protein
MDSWSLFRLVRQRSQKSCRLEFEDRPLERASLFPLFDDEGRTRMVMITAEENARIMLADWTPGVFTRDWAMRNRISRRFADLNDASMVNADGFEDLWHFDPWWVLGEERYQGHGAVPGLRSTNIPGYDPNISGIVFDRGLERASYVVTGSDHSVHARRFKASTLAAVAGRRRAASGRSSSAVEIGWRLRPSWRSL